MPSSCDDAGSPPTQVLALEEAARERDATYVPLVGALQQERQLLWEQLQVGRPWKARVLGNQSVR